MEKKNFPLILISALLTLASCDTKTKSVDACGDGFVDPGEECDTGVGENTCASLGYYHTAGTLLCTSLCSFDSTDCGGRCGDEIVDGEDGEECDGGDLNGNTCQGLGHGGGTLACAADCTFDRSGCTSACGNGYLEGDEACDDGNRLPDDGCSATCEVDAGWECVGEDPSVCTPICQDGIAMGSEDCDGADLRDRTCGTEGYYGGTLACTASCEYDWSGCEDFGRCGDGVVQPGAGELCDGADLDQQTCGSLGFHPGTLSCNADCRGFDTSACAGRCGDGTIQLAEGEVCDLNALQGETCVTQGFYGGLLGCSADCLSFNLDGCAVSGRCGDGTIQLAFGEVCESGDLDGQTCVTRGFYGGTLACGSNCMAFDDSSCAAVGRCGDATVQAGFGEVCDGAVLGGQTCITRGYYGGTLACAGNCQAFAEADCALYGRCGDGTIQDLHGEVCDGLQTGGVTCRILGHYAGVLGCASDCLNTSESACLDITSLDSGDTHACIVLTDGTVRCWGKNLNGELGDGTSGGFRNVPVIVSGLTNVQAVSAGEAFSCALKTDGTVWCWGQNTYGQLGNGTSVNSLAPVAVPGLTGVTALAAGSVHLCVRKNDGTARCWGLNSSGQLGNGTTTSSSSPVTVSGLSGVVALASGVYHSCALLGGGTVKCWGSNVNGQLGDGSLLNRSMPVDVGSLAGVSSMGAGGHHTCAILSDGTARCWGRNSNGQLGDGSYTQAASPVTVTGLTGAVSIGGGVEHSCAALGGGAVKCWGANWVGQLGDGTETGAVLPVTVSGLSSATSVSLGLDFSCAVTGPGRVRCWGANVDGQLGDGTGVPSRTTPSTVSQ